MSCPWAPEAAMQANEEKVEESSLCNHPPSHPRKDLAKPQSDWQDE